MENKNYLPIIIVAILAAVAVAIWAVWFRSPEKAIDQVGQIGGEILEKAQNPIKGGVTETNPFKTEANPFSTDLNPFQGVYENPFQ